jgi:hypothetical protein
MYIKNVAERPLEIEMETRTLKMKAGEIELVTAVEVRDPVLREHLQVRSVAIVRPATPEEEAPLLKQLADNE